MLCGKPATLDEFISVCKSIIYELHSLLVARQSACRYLLGVGGGVVGERRVGDE